MKNFWITIAVIDVLVIATVMLIANMLGQDYTTVIMHVITKLREQLAERRAKALKDAELRHLRTEILHILYAEIPKQEDMKQRTDMVDTIATQIVRVIDATKEKAQAA